MLLALSLSSVAALAGMCALLFVVVVALSLHRRRSRGRFPAGPFCIPLLGPLPIGTCD